MKKRWRRVFILFLVVGGFIFYVIAPAMRQLIRSEVYGLPEAGEQVAPPSGREEVMILHANGMLDRYWISVAQIFEFRKNASGGATYRYGGASEQHQLRSGDLLCMSANMMPDHLEALATANNRAPGMLCLPTTAAA